MVTIEFPMVQTVEKHTEPNYDISYTCTFKGNTLVDIVPRTERPGRLADGADDGTSFGVNAAIPLYRRDAYKANEAPMKRAKRYVASRFI
jgi:hypothetical protein